MMKLTLDTKQFSDLLGIHEGELVFAFKHKGTLQGVPLPEGIYNSTWKKRKFSYDAVMKFKIELDKRSHGS
jgi:hypothetical protein